VALRRSRAVEKTRFAPSSRPVSFMKSAAERQRKHAAGREAPLSIALRSQMSVPPKLY